MRKERIEKPEFRVENGTLKGSNFAGHEMEYARIFDTDLTGTNFTGTDLNRALIMGCNCTNVNFTNANMKGACLSFSTFEGAIFDGADLEGAEFGDATVQYDFSKAKTMPKGLYRLADGVITVIPPTEEQQAAIDEQVAMLALEAELAESAVDTNTDIAA